MCERNPGEITAVGDLTAAVVETLVLNAQSWIVCDIRYGSNLLTCRVKTGLKVEP